MRRVYPTAIHPPWIRSQGFNIPASIAPPSAAASFQRRLHSASIVGPVRKSLGFERAITPLSRWISSPAAMTPPGLLAVRYEPRIPLPDWSPLPNPNFRSDFRPIQMPSFGFHNCRGLRRPWRLIFPAAYPLSQAEQAWAKPIKAIWLCLGQPTGWTACICCPMNRTKPSSRGSNNPIMHWDPGPLIDTSSSGGEQGS